MFPVTPVALQAGASHKPPLRSSEEFRECRVGSTTSQRISTPKLKELVEGKSDLLDDPKAAALLLNGPASPSRSRVRKTLVEVAYEKARSRSTSPVDPCNSPSALHQPPPPRQVSATGSASLPRPSSASPSLFHTVGPRELARLKVKMRSQSPWALHIGEDTMTYEAMQAAKKAEENAKKALYVASLAAAVEQRKRDSEARRAAEILAERESIAVARSFDSAMSSAKKMDQEAKLAQQQLQYMAYLESQRLKRDAHEQLKEQHRFQAQQERSEASIQMAEEMAKKREKFISAAAAHRRAQERRDQERRQAARDSQAELECAVMFWDEQERKRQAEREQLEGSRSLIAQRAEAAASAIKPAKKQVQQDLIASAFEKTASELLTTNVLLNESAQLATRRRCEQASIERQRLLHDKEASKMAWKTRKMEEESAYIARDLAEKEIFEQALQEAKMEQKASVREHLDLQRRLALKKAVEEILDFE